MNTLHARAGRIMGRDHIGRQANCQDSYCLIEREAYTVGVVCDGCGEGQHSEVGATLAAPYLAEQIAALYEAGQGLAELPFVSSDKLIGFLEGLIELAQPADRLGFIKDYLLFTILAVIATPLSGVAFAIGDGTVAIDDCVYVRDQNNQPHYLAYQLVDGKKPLIDTYPLGEWRQIALATDGFELPLLSQVWGQSHQRGLQRKLNAWSGEDHHFRDDATIIAIERIER